MLKEHTQASNLQERLQTEKRNTTGSSLGSIDSKIKKLSQKIRHCSKMILKILENVKIF
ncbi:hypothetical protein [Piscirickettsia litoralis]|uniref:hypothetical protein n=1 Tax=Piscirickettsia litoralis TaxID=1891921 RepID=UPI001300E22F|nr:hypothetical protein [Piscirickettsia litoralis]